MKIKNFFITLLFLVFFTFNTSSQEVLFEASNMDVKDNGNIILGYNSKTNIPLENIIIEAKNTKYIKDKNIIIFTGKVIFTDNKNNIIINSPKITYERNKNLIYSSGNTKFYIEDKYKIKSNNVFYNRASNKIYSNEETTIWDDEINIYNLNERFNFDIIDEIIRSNKSTIIDKESNKYFFSNLAINLKNNEIAGKELKIEYERSHFGNADNEPRLKGRSSYSNDDELKVYKGVFSTCNIQNKKCRGWELNTD